MLILFFKEMPPSCILVLLLFLGTHLIGQAFGADDEEDQFQECQEEFQEGIFCIFEIYKLIKK